VVKKLGASEKAAGRLQMTAVAAACVGLVAAGISAPPLRAQAPAAKKTPVAQPASKTAAAQPSDPSAKKSVKKTAAQAAATKKTAPKTKAATRKVATPTGPALPPGFVPPPPLPQVMGLNNALLTPKDDVGFRRTAYSAYMKAVRSPGLGTKAQQDIRAGVRWAVARLTMPASREILPVRRREIRQLVQLQAKTPQVRNFILQELTLALSELLETAHFKISHNNGTQIVVEITRPDPKTGKLTTQSFKADSLQALRAVQGAAEAVRYFERYSSRSVFAGRGGLQNFHVRLNVAYLLGELVAEKGDLSKGIPDKRYTLAAYPLCDAIDETRQLDAIKVVAVRGLVRLMKTGLPEPNYDLQLKVATCLANQLKRPFQRSVIRQRLDSHLQHIWYQEVLVEGLAGVGILVNKNAQPFVETTLAGVMADPNRHFLARTSAAKALGRAPLAGSFDDGLRSFQLAELASQMAASYNKGPRAGYWPRCFQNLYFAFKAINKSDVTVTGKPAGLIGQVGSARVQDAYRQIVPLVAHVIVQPTVSADGQQVFQPISSDTIKPLSDWMAQNKPANYKPIQPTGGTAPTSSAQPASSKKPAGTKKPTPAGT